MPVRNGGLIGDIYGLYGLAVRASVDPDRPGLKLNRARV
jgi:hypothetical protein